MALIISCSTKEQELIKVDINGILDQYAADNYALNPLEATANGIDDYNDQLAINLSDKHIKKSIALNNEYLDTLKTISYQDLNATDQLSFDLFNYQLGMDNEWLNNRYLWFSRPVDQFVASFPQKFALLASGSSYVPFKNEQDYRNFIERMKGFATWTDQAIVVMQNGLELNNTNPKAAMVKVPAQLQPLYEKKPDENILYKPIRDLPDGIDSTKKGQLVADYSKAIETILKPAYKRLNDFLEQTYIPNTRETTGLVDNSGGEEEYSFLIRYYTSIDITADSVYQLGLSEVARIRKEMDSLRAVTGFEGDLQEFFNFIKTDEQFFPFKTDEEVLDRYRSFQSKMEPQLKKMFNLRPKTKFEVRATEKFREAGSNAQYSRPSRDGSRPGIFYETVRDPIKYNAYEMETIFIHEAIPGHHYQISLQYEADLPEFRITHYTGAYTEGWALYAESLGTELGMFKDPYQYMGRLNNEMERAVRLVVDAGIHSKGWSREKGIAYVLENQPVTPFVAEQRIERYMIWPAQATSYKIGELKIIQLREKAKKALGSQFDIREFHDEILKDGAMPLGLLETKIDRWIEGKNL